MGLRPPGPGCIGEMVLHLVIPHSPEKTRFKDQLMRVPEHKSTHRGTSLRLGALIATSLQILDQVLGAAPNDTRTGLANRPLIRSHHSAEEETTQ